MQLLLEGFTGLLGLDQGRFTLAESQAIVGDLLLLLDDLGGASFQGIRFLSLLSGLGVQLLRPLVEVDFFLGQSFLQVAQTIDGGLHGAGPLLDLLSLLIMMPFFIIPFGAETMNLLDAALQVRFGLFLAIALLGELKFLATQIFALFLQASAERGERCLLALQMGRSLGYLSHGRILFGSLGR